MPLIPPWPIDVLTQLRTIQTVLQRAKQMEPRDPAIDAVAGDVAAAIAKLEALGYSQK
jgi:hypothetical protein